MASGREDGADGDRAIRSILVAGTGIVGLSAALAFARALPGVAITLLETAPDPAALTDALPGTLPSVHRFHAAIGLDELDLVGTRIALHRLGTRFIRWSAGQADWYHTFGEHGLKAGDVPFHLLWVQVRAAGQAGPFHGYSAAAALAASGRFVHPAEDPASPLSTFLYGLNLDPPRYRARLEAAASALPRLTGAIADVERRADGGLAALRLEDGRRLEADLYLDCTGPGAQLLSRLDDRFEDWNGWLPCDRIVLSSRPKDFPDPCDRAVAEANGWRWEVPLPDRILQAELFASTHAPTEAVGIAIRPGRRPEPWIGNVLALGDAALALDPLHGAGLHLAQSGILRALDLLPGRDARPVEIGEYNRRTQLEAERVLDFLALHYLRSGRSDTGFWRDMADREPPDGLARTLEQFVRRGRLPFFEEESFAMDSWLAALLGLGVVPQDSDPVALGVDLERAKAGMEAWARRLTDLPARLPPYPRLLDILESQGRSGGAGRRMSAIRSPAGAIGGSPFSGRSR